MNKAKEMKPGQVPMPRYKGAYLNEDKTRGLHIVYAVMDEHTGKYKRYFFKLNRFKKNYPTRREMQQFARGLISELNIKLAGGWSPEGEMHSARYYTPVTEVIDAYLRDRKGDVRRTTYLSYSSVTGVLREWCEAHLKGCKAIDFNRVHALSFMQYLLDERHVSNRTYNNYLKQMSMLFSWAEMHCYCKEDPFKAIKTRRREPKQRTVIDAHTRARMRVYLKNNDPAFLCFLEMVYSSLMRPMEIRRCRVSQLDFENHRVHIPAEQAKNWHRRYAPMSDELAHMLSQYLGQHRHRQSDYLFSTGFRPGRTMLSQNGVNLRWQKVRKALSLPEEMKVYSLRDSAIVDLLHAGLDDLTVMHAAGHHDLSITSEYADHADAGLIERIRGAGVEF